jgi:hypothetical protein
MFIGSQRESTQVQEKWRGWALSMKQGIAVVSLDISEWKEQPRTTPSIFLFAFEMILLVTFVGSKSPLQSCLSHFHAQPAVAGFSTPS